MAFVIKTIGDADKPKAYVTVIQTDAQGDPISGRSWTEKFSTVDKDWAELKGRFKKRIQKSNTEAQAIEDLITEANNEGITDMS